MNAAHLAAKLEQQGYAAMNIQEPSFEEDGLIQISNEVHVQVPLDSEYGANVVREAADGAFVFDEPRRAFDDLVADLRCALRDAETGMDAAGSTSN